MVILPWCFLVSWLPAQGRSAITEVKLDNGLKVLLLEVPRTGAVSVGCWYRVGSKDEPLGSTGISHWVEHMAFQGTQAFSGGRFRSAIEEAGGTPSGYTFLDQTGYFTTVAGTALDSMLALESSRMASCIMGSADAERVRRRLLLEQQALAHEPQNSLDVDVTAAALKIHPYRWPTMGWFRDLETVTPTQLQDYYRLFYAPNNAILVLVGDFQALATLDAVKKHFGNISRKPDPPRILSHEPAQEGERRIKIVREGEGLYLEIAYHSPDILNDDFYAFLVLDAALNGVQGMNLWSAPGGRETSKSSRLYRALVEKKSALRVSSTLFPTQNPYLYKLTLKLPDVFQFQAAEEAVYDELDKLKSQGLKDYELAKARNQLVSRTYLDQDSLSKLGHQLGFFEAIASYKVLGSLEEKIGRITNDDLRRVAIKYFAENSRTVGWFLSIKRPEKIEVEKLSSRVSPGLPAGILRPAFNDPPSFDSLAGNGIQSSEREVGRNPIVSTIEKPSTGAAQGILHPQIAIQPNRKTLSNGLVLAVAENNLSPTVAIEACIKAGSLRDRDETAGIAYFVGRMLERGTKNRNLLQVAEGFDYLGADLAISTDYLVTTLKVNGLARDAAALIQQLADLIQAPVFPPAEVERVRAGILAELREEADDPQIIAEQTLRTRIYPAQHPFGRGVKGTVRTVQTLKASDLVAFYKRYYRPDSVVIAVVGAVNPGSLTQMIEEQFGKWTVPGPREAFTVPPASAGLGKGPYVIKKNLGPYCEIALGFPGISRTNSDYFTMLLINQILGDAQSQGRLGLRLVDREGLADRVYTAMDASISEGPWSIRIRTVPEHVDRALQAVGEEIHKIQSEGVSDEELLYAKRRLINLLPTHLESNRGIASELLEMQLFELGENYLNWYPGMIESVTAERVKACLKTRLPIDLASIVIVGQYPSK